MIKLVCHGHRTIAPRGEIPYHGNDNEDIVPEKSAVQLDLAYNPEQDSRGGEYNEEDDDSFQAGFLRVIVTQWFGLVRDHLHAQLHIAATLSVDKMQEKARKPGWKQEVEIL